MAQVYNWQIGRDMEFPYKESDTTRQFAAVFNINRCIGCQTCTMACKSTWTFSPGQELMWWNNVETKPFGGYPRHWDVNTLALQEERDAGNQVWDPDQSDPTSAPYGRFDGKTIFESASGTDQRVTGYIPTEAEWKAPNIFEDAATKYPAGGTQLPEHSGWFFYLQRICNHCSYPACLAACPRNAIYKRPEDGIVLVDEERCRGYRKCVEACPYKKSMYRPTTRTTEKCIGCFPRIEGQEPITNGLPTETRCMTACVGKIRMQGLADVDLDGQWLRDPDNPLFFLVHVVKVALPLYPQFGTEPNVYYIPPRWVPRPYLRQMFGPGVDEAIERYTNPSRKLLAVLQLFRTAQAIIFRFEIEEGPKISEITVNGRLQEIYNDTAIGFDANDNELVRVSVQEPFFERPGKQNSI